MKGLKLIPLYAVLLACAGPFATAQELADTDPDQLTTVRVTDNILVEDCSRFGINLGGDNYYSGSVLVKKRVRCNFEGTSYRQCHFGPVWKANGASTWFGVPEPWRRILVGSGTFTVLSGPGQWTSGTIREVSSVPYDHQGEMIEQDFFVFDRQIPETPPNSGLLVENFRLDEGQLPHRPHHYWMSESVTINTGDVPPGSFGVAAARLDGRREQSFIRFATHYHRYGRLNGTWRVNVWAKAVSGEPELKVACSREEYGGSATVRPSGEWRKYELSVTADAVPEPEGPDDSVHLTFVVSAAGGQVLVDDIEAWLEGDENPTAFRDDCLRMLRKYNPGPVRYLQMGGNTVENTLRPPMRAHSYTSRKTDRPGPQEGHRKSPYGLHQMYELCEYIGAEPWYCLPGTLQREEIASFMEYLGGPPDTPYGRIRAEMGHPRPWTEVFDRIHVEFGNEAWNNAGPYQLGGYNGPDYWESLIATGKSSPHYTPKVVFHAGGQAANSWLNGIMLERVPNADRLGLAPYIIQRFNEEDMELLDTDEKFFRWAFAWPLRRSLHEDGAMYENCRAAKEAGIELSIYEVNHHITHGDAPPAPRNKLVTSIGGGLNVANTMLLMLKEHHLRTQCLFSLVQHGYRASTGTVRLWGTALNMREGHERYRPTFLACMLANKVMGGDLVETAHTGQTPTFSATGVFSRREGVETMERLPTIWSYAFREGNRRGLILVNLDVSEPRPVALEFEGQVREEGAQWWLLSADEITANNEFEQADPRVRITEGALEDFTSGRRIQLPPHSMMALQWHTR
ncbi:MAG: hypothetical protein R6X33_05240 [Candidatus Brocadiia bacterium]